MPRTSQSSWLLAWSSLGVADSPALRELHADVLSRYSESHRHYHTAQHLGECLEKVQPILSSAQHPAEVEIGLWFHDAIYDTRRHDNEERSAQWARSAAVGLGCAADAGQRIHELVMATRHAAEPVGIDAQVLVDADLSILGAESGRFQEYETQVRAEYVWVPEPMFRGTRAKILKEFLARPSLFATPFFRSAYEARARDNLQNSLRALESA